MDLHKAIRELYEEKRRLEHAIASLEDLLKSGAGSGPGTAGGAGPRGRRGRKSMPPEERRKVSERMKRYWAQRRTGNARNARKGHS